MKSISRLCSSIGRRRFCEYGVQVREGRILGKSYDQSVDLTTVRIGQPLDTVTYETTIANEWRTKWQSCFFQQERIHTSSQYCANLGLKAIPMPFDLVCNYTSAMTHVDETRMVWEIRLSNCVYINPVFPGDTLTKAFVIQDVRDTTDGKNILVDIDCTTFANGVPVFNLLKTMMFTKMQRVQLDPYAQTFPEHVSVAKSNFEKMIVNSPENLPNSRSLINLQPGMLIIHGLQRPLGLSNSLELAMLFRMIHPNITNTARLATDQLVVPGPQMVALTCSASGRELYEILSQKIITASFVNKLSPQEPVGAVSYVKNTKRISHKLEEVTLVTVGIKNIDVARYCTSADLPRGLFEHVGMRPSKVRALCQAEAPVLADKVITHVERKIIRMTARDEPVFLL